MAQSDTIIPEGMNNPLTRQLLDQFDWNDRASIPNQLGMAVAVSLDPDSILEEEERQRIEDARTRMRDFVQYTYPMYVADYFHLSVCDYIDRVVHKDHPKHISHLMLHAPPQHGKSEIVSTRLPSYWLGHNPDLPVAMMSYNARLALRNSRRARGVITSPSYTRLFTPLGIMPEKSGAKRWTQNEWHLADHDGYVFAAGRQGDFTGEGFGLGVIDDPIKDWAEAQSEIVRESLWDWWQGTFITRFWENHCMIFMMTRWHEDDIAGREISHQGNINVCRDCGKYMPDDIEPKRCPKCGGERGKWKVLRYPGLAESQEERDAANKDYGLPAGLPDILGREEGAPLAPSKRPNGSSFGKKFMVQIMRDVGSLVWGAEYQQHPTPPQGDFFKVGRIIIEQDYPREFFGGNLINLGDNINLDLFPTGLKNCIRFWDLAGTEETGGKDPDWTVGVLVGIDETTGLTWVLHVVRLRGSPESVADEIKKTAHLDGKRVKVGIEQEPGQAGKKEINDYIRLLAGYDVGGVPPTGAKDVRARPLSVQVNNGNMRILEAKWNTPWMAILRGFPFAKHDDDVDATAGAFGELTEPSSKYHQKFKSL